MKSKFIRYLDIAIEYLIYGGIFYIPISIALVSIFITIAIMLFFLKKFLSPDLSSIRSNKIFFGILLIFFICMALSLFNSGPLIAKSLKALFQKWGRFFFVLWMILDTFQDTKRIVKAVGVLLFGATLVMFSILSQKFFGLEFLRHKVIGNGLVSGPFATQIDLASYLTCVIPVVLSFSLWKWERASIKIGFWVVTTILMISSYWTHCRGGWIGLAAGLIFFALFMNHGRLPKKIFWTLFSVGYIFCLPLLAIGLFFIKKDPERIYLYRGAWKMITEHPFLGKGLGTFMNYCTQYTHDSWVCYAHNCFLQIWAESGIFSLLSFLLFNGYIIYKFSKVFLKMPVTLNSYILIGLGTGYLGLLVHCFFDTQLYSFQLSYLFWVVIGLTVALTESVCIKK